MFLTKNTSDFLYTDAFRNQMSLVNLGVTVFQRNNSKFSGTECIYRIVQDGILNILPYMTKRVIKTTSLDIFKQFILSRYNQFDEWCFDDNFKKEIEDLSTGCFVFVLELPGGDVEALSMHKFKNALSTMISKDHGLSLHMRYLTKDEREAG